MATETSTAAESTRETADRSASLSYGATVMAVSFVALSGFGLVLALRLLGGQGVVESGVDIGSTTTELAAFNPLLPASIVHLRMAAAGLFVALGIAGAGLAWYGVRRGQRWVWWVSMLAFVAGLVIGLPMHYVGGFHVDQVRHLGRPYVILAWFVVGAAVAYAGLRSAASED